MVEVYFYFFFFFFRFGDVGFGLTLGFNALHALKKIDPLLEVSYFFFFVIVVVVVLLLLLLYRCCRSCSCLLIGINHRNWLLIKLLKEQDLQSG